MTRKQLEDLGISKEQIDSIMKINGEDIENAKTGSAAEIKNMQTEISGLKTQVSDRDRQLETLKASAFPIQKRRPRSDPVNASFL